MGRNKAWQIWARAGRSLLCATAALLLGLSTAAHAEGTLRSTPTALVSPNPEEPAQFGISSAAVGDLNGDGFDDVIVGAPRESAGGQSRAGAAHVFLGSASGIATVPALTLISPVPEEEGRFGAVASAGDINGDGLPDFVIGATGEMADGKQDAGNVYVYLGSGAVIPSTPTSIVRGTQVGGFFGVATPAGDINGDGFDDVVLASSLESAGGLPFAGNIYIFHGSAAGLAPTPATVLPGTQANRYYGGPVSSLGDINGDGFGDLIVGNPTRDIGTIVAAGRVEIFRGSAAGLITTPVLTIDGTQASGGFGYGVASAGDVNGDGFSDVTVGASLETPNGLHAAGRVYVYPGTASGVSATPMTVLVGTQLAGQFGIDTAPAGDVNRDGYADVLVAAYSERGLQQQSGNVHLFLGSATGLPSTPNLTLQGKQTGSWFGSPVKFLGDVNGDGRSDVLVGASAETVDGRPTAGRVYVYYGAETPAAPTALTATAGVSQVSLHWSSVIGATSYRVFVGTSPGGQSSSAQTTVTGTTATITGLVNGITYYFTVKAVSDAGASAPSNEASATPALPVLPVPDNLSATPGNAEVTLNWTAAAGAISYSVFRGTFPGGQGAFPIAYDITGTSFVVGGLTNGTPYYFTVKAVYSIPEVTSPVTSGPSNEATATPMAPPVVILPAPAGLTATGGDGIVTLAWSASAGAASYNVYQGTRSGAQSLTAVRTGITDTSVALGGLTNGVPYFYVVRAVEGTRLSDVSNEASATPQGTPLPIPTGLSATAGDRRITLTWAASMAASSYNVYQGTTSGGESSTPVRTGIVETSTTITELGNGTTYYFTVRAVSGPIISRPSNEASATPQAPALAPPTGLNATAGDRSITLAWTAAAGASSYNVYQGTIRGGESPTPVRSGLVGTSTTVTGLGNGTTYYFVVRAVSGANTSEPSNEVSAAPVAPSGGTDGGGGGGGGGGGALDLSLVAYALIAALLRRRATSRRHATH
jgi:fibronectin type 3 domain-containing protein